MMPNIFGRCCRKYAVNELFFRDISTEAQAYVLGVMASDGTCDKQRLSIRVKEDDASWLLQIRAAMESEHPISSINNKNTLAKEGRSRLAGLKISSISLASDLARLGLAGNKTARVVPWDGPKPLLRHFWRGMMDGDGHITFHPFKNSTYRSQRYECRLGLCGTPSVAEGFSEFVRDSLGFPLQIEKRNPVFWVARIASFREVRAVANLLYDGATIALERKAAKVAAMKSVQIRRRWVHVPLEEFHRLKAVHGTWEEVARQLQMPYQQLSKTISRLGFTIPRIPRGGRWRDQSPQTTNVLDPHAANLFGKH